MLAEKLRPRRIKCFITEKEKKKEKQSVCMNKVWEYRNKLTLIWGRGGGEFNPPPPLFISLYNSETIKAVTLAFCNILRQGYFQFPDFWSIPYKRKWSLTPEPVMIYT